MSRSLLALALVLCSSVLAAGMASNMASNPASGGLVNNEGYCGVAGITVNNLAIPVRTTGAANHVDLTEFDGTQTLTIDVLVGTSAGADTTAISSTKVTYAKAGGAEGSFTQGAVVTDSALLQEGQIGLDFTAVVTGTSSPSSCSTITLHIRDGACATPVNIIVKRAGCADDDDNENPGENQLSSTAGETPVVDSSTGPATPETPVAAPCPAGAANDLVALNYALTLEHLEATFYAQGQAKWTAADFIAAGETQETFDRFTLIAAHEAAHVVALTATVTAFGGTPVPACVYNLDISTVAKYIALAKVLENTGVMAYDAAINHLSDTGLLQVAATIATVEARHAAFLNHVSGTSPFPDALDMAKLPAEIAAAIAPLLVSCPYTIELPTIKPGGVKFSSTVAPLPATPSTPAGVYTKEQADNDLVALNYALTLENLEATFYNLGLAKFTQADFAAAGYDAQVYSNFVLIGAHENAHVSALNSLISGRGGSPVPACEYNVEFTTVGAFIDLAKLLENTGVSAYDGAVNTIADIGLSVIAATVATVEARHAAYINKLDGESPFPAAYDTALSPAQIAAAVGPLIKSCSYTIQLPQIAPPPKCPTAGETAQSSTGAATPTPTPGTGTGECTLTGLELGSDMSFFPTFNPNTLQYYCSCAQSTFLGTVTATTVAGSASSLELSINGAKSPLVTGVQSGSYNLAVGSNTLTVTVDGNCKKVYQFNCDRPEPEPGMVAYQWSTSAYSTCSGVCTSNTGTASGTFSRNVACVSQTGAAAEDAMCSGTKPATSNSCVSVCATLQRDAGVVIDDNDNEGDDDDRVCVGDCNSAATARVSFLMLLLAAFGAVALAKRV